MVVDAGENIESGKVFEVADGVFVRRAIDNLGWIDMGGYTLVVDTLEEPVLESDVLTAMESTVGKQPVRYVLNTHTHPDHIALNPVFERMGAEIVNARSHDIPMEGRVFEGEKRELHFIPLPGCHTMYDCVAWLPAAKTLFVGDLFGWGLIPWMGNLTDERRQTINDVYQRLLDFEPVVVVPGHGPLCEKGELARWRDYLQWLIETVAERINQGVPPAEINGETLPPPEDLRHWWRFYQWKHEDSLKKVVKAASRKQR